VVYQENGSEFCSNIADGLPQIARGSWSGGSYDIYVGLPDEGGTAVDYTLTVYESP
jgi:hypothetical protein